MPTVHVRDIELYYELKGAGPRLLVISGTGADLRNRPNVFDTALAKQFEILAFDQRGLGQSSRPDIPYTMADYAMDALALLDELSWDKCHVMGVSFGGMVAQEFAIRYQDRIKRLVLCCTSSGGRGGHSYPLHKHVALSVDEMNAKFLSISDTRHDEAWRRANPQQFADQMALRMLQNAGKGEANREIGARRQLEARIDHDTFDRLEHIKLPVFIAGGRFDGIAPQANQRAINQQIEGSRLSFYEGGHDFYNTDPVAYNDISDFINKHAEQ